MAQPDSKPGSVTRTGIALMAVFALLQLAGTTDLLSNVTRPIVVGLLKLGGVSAQDGSHELMVGRMSVPWTRDCAGVNILTVLWAVILWANRSEPLSRRYWFRLVLAVPTALVVNIARIFTLIGYRYAFYPSVESPQLHYFIGFLWVIPGLPFFVPRGGRTLGRYFLETLYLVAALALLSPFVPAPGGTLVSLATLLHVAQARYKPVSPAGIRAAPWLWLLAALFIAVAGMESLWLPWLLACPWFMEMRRLRNPVRAFLLLGTIPLMSMHPFGRLLVFAAALHEIYCLWAAGPAADTAPQDPLPRLRFARYAGEAGIALMLVCPFLAPSVAGLTRPKLRPPTGVMARALADNTYQLRLIGQPAEVEMMWYGPSGDGRHHTLPVCMRYRGVELKPSGTEPSVMTDGKNWMREFFLHRGELLTDYRAYLRHTLWPWSPAGVHLISVGPVKNMSASAFARQSLAVARELESLQPRIETAPKYPVR